MKEKETIDEILRFLSINDVDCFNAGYAIHSKVISEALKIDYEKTKKIMKKMKKEGLVVYENKSYTVCDDYELQIFYKMRNTGWLLTDKARQTNIWKEESEKEKKIFQKCFGGENK